MTHIFRATAVLAAFMAVPAGQALAADYDPPIYVEEAPQHVPVEIGSGWYLRGDITYNAGKPHYDFHHAGIKHRRFGAGAGVGYHFDDNFRADLTISYLGKDTADYSWLGDTANGSYSAWSGLVSGYYDIATIAGFTPYVGAGVGLLYSRQKYDIAAPSIPHFATLDDSSYDFAYALMAGASYKMTDNVSLDLGYQFLHAPDAKYLDEGTFTLREGRARHQIKLGLRYDLW